MSRLDTTFSKKEKLKYDYEFWSKKCDRIVHLLDRRINTMIKP